MSGFFAKIFCCGSGKATQMASRPEAVPSHSSRHTNDNRHTANSRHSHNHHTTEERERRRQPPPPKPKKTLLKITSQYTAQTVKAVETRSEETKEYKFMCPICLRYFDRILTTTCCENYVCHHCANDINEKVLKDEKIHVARCPICSSENFELVDVNITVKPKKYTDSFASSFKSNTKGGPFGNTQFVNRLAGTINNRDQLYASAIAHDQNPYSVDVRDDFRSASDGLQYFNREPSEVTEQPRFNKTADFTNGMSDGAILQRDFTDILSRRDNRSERPRSRHTESEIEERKSNALDDSLNDRDPIDVIKEDEFENSTVTNLDRRAGLGGIGNGSPSPYF